MGNYKKWEIIGISLVVSLACLWVAESTNPSGPDGPEQAEYAPPSGRAP